MTRETYPVEIERGDVAEAGEPCPNCSDETNLVEAEVTIVLREDGGRWAATTRECCSDCVWHVIRDEHAVDAAPHVLLTADAPVPPGVHDPIAS